MIELDWFERGLFSCLSHCRSDGSDAIGADARYQLDRLDPANGQLAEDTDPVILNYDGACESVGVLSESNSFGDVVGVTDDVADGSG